jgi:hypothetical protein
VSDDKYVDELSQAAQRAGNIVTEHIDSIIADAKRRADQIREDADRDAALTKREAMDSASRVFQSIQTLERPLGELVETLRFEMNRVGREFDGQVGSQNGTAIESTATDDDTADDAEDETTRSEAEVDGEPEEESPAPDVDGESGGESLAADSDVKPDEEPPATDAEVELDEESPAADSDGEPGAESLVTDSGVAPEPAADSGVAASEPDPEAAAPAEPDPESLLQPGASDPGSKPEAEEHPPGDEPGPVAESDTPAEADPAAEPEWHSPPAAAATSSPGKAKRWLTSRFGGDGETKGVFISSQGHCAVCQKTFMAGSKEALDLSGWRVNGDVGLCPECQSNGWQLPQDATLPYRRGGG